MTEPRLPPGQVLTQKWPVLTYEGTPRVDLKEWTFRCFGLVEREVSWTWQEFRDLPRVEVTSDIHCVTRWSRFDNRWEGVAVSEILRRAGVRPDSASTRPIDRSRWIANEFIARAAPRTSCPVTR